MNWDELKTTRYFIEQVLFKRPYLKSEWIEEIINKRLNETIQGDGRIRYWGYIEEDGKYLRVITLEDRQTVHNAFFDRNFKEK